MSFWDYFVRTDFTPFLLIFLLIILIFAFIIFLDYTTDHFRPLPKIKYKININKQRAPTDDDLIDNWLIYMHQQQSIDEIYYEAINQWKTKCEKYLGKTLFFKKHKAKTYQKDKQIVDDKTYNIFELQFVREQTRYKQKNYVKTSYIVENVDRIIEIPYFVLSEIDDELDDIGYETTRQKYFSNNQRKLMTAELRQKIKERDNYTCQVCGKKMFDEVGLHIDHIIPIKMGGKTVESNLQVLCSKCNLHKSSKVDFQNQETPKVL